tara:strand:- start:473 stop:976 length:504 start_codon:yes stop_codon:yes gene_type:complete
MDIPINVINGRINVSGNQDGLAYKNNNEKQNLCNYATEAISHTTNRTPLSDIFFSQQNMDIVQLGMRNMILNKTNGAYNIGKQNETELKIIMRAMFIQHAKYRTDIPVNVQIQEINRQVLNFAVPRIISSLNMKRKYLQDIQQLPMPLEHAKSMSTKGTKELELKEF